jgi:hypothetical protein
LAGAERSLRRTSGGGATVAVQLKGRPWLAVLGDMIEGVVATNRLTGSQADHCRTTLWQAIERSDNALGATVTPGPGWRNRQTQAA